MLTSTRARAWPDIALAPAVPLMSTSAPKPPPDVTLTFGQLVIGTILGTVYVVLFTSETIE